MNISIDQIKGIIQENQETPTDLSNLTDETPLEEIGLDSIGMVSMAFELEDLTGFTVEDDALDTIKTLGDIRQLLTNQGVTVN